MTSHRSIEPRNHTRPLAAVAWLLMVTCISVAPVGAVTGPDADDDGVVDAVDACPNTEPADLAGPDGCAVCRCDVDADGVAWTSHKDYLACVRAGIRDGRAAGTIDAADARMLARRARHSTCGNAALIRCCVFPTFDDDSGRCRIMTEEACDALDDRLFATDGEADSEDAGSCLPNPCAF
jgi:hypothetical protein